MVLGGEIWNILWAYLILAWELMILFLDQLMARKIGKLTQIDHTCYWWFGIRNNLKCQGNPRGEYYYKIQGGLSYLHMLVCGCTGQINIDYHACKSFPSNSHL